MNRITRATTAGLFLAVLAYLTYRILGDFILPIAWAVILVYSSWPLYALVKRQLGGRGGWSASLMVAAIGLALVLPLVGFSVILKDELAEFLRQLPGWLEQKPEVPAWLAKVPFIGNELRSIFGQFDDLQGLARRYAAPWGSKLSGQAVSMLEGAGFAVAKLLLTLLLMFFLYRDGAALAAEARRGLALALGERGPGYFSTAELTVKAVIYGIVLTALVQALIAGLGYWGVGLQAPVLLTFVTFLVAMIPFGTPFAWGGAALWLFLHGEHMAGLALLLWGALVVSWVDNVIRPLVISHTTQIPFILVMLGVLGGLGSFGFIGLFLGPVVLAIALGVWKEWLHTAQPDPP